METVKDRLVQFIKYKGLSQRKFETALGVSNAFVNNIRTSIQPEKLQQIAKLFPELNVGWLMVGEELGGPMIVTENIHNPTENLHNSMDVLPLIPVEAFAGPGEPVYDDISNLTYYSVNEFYGSDFLLRVKGDSMTPKYNGGDIVACKKVTDMLFFQWGRIYVLYTKSQGVMIKRIQPSEDKDFIKCVSDNDKYAPFDVPKSDIVSLALVNGSISLE